MTPLKPATPLPWRATGAQVRDALGNQGGGRDSTLALCVTANQHEDAAYIVAACNNMPRLLALLNAAVDDDADWRNDALVALKEMGART